MYNPDVLERIAELAELYKQRWGNDVFDMTIPNTLSQEKSVRILEHIVDTGESIVGGMKYVNEWE